MWSYNFTPHIRSRGLHKDKFTYITHFPSNPTNYNKGLMSILVFIFPKAEQMAALFENMCESIRTDNITIYVA